MLLLIFFFFLLLIFPLLLLLLMMQMLPCPGLSFQACLLFQLSMKKKGRGLKTMVRILKLARAVNVAQQVKALA